MYILTPWVFSHYLSNCFTEHSSGITRVEILLRCSIDNYCCFFASASSPILLCWYPRLTERCRRDSLADEVGIIGFWIYALPRASNEILDYFYGCCNYYLGNEDFSWILTKDILGISAIIIIFYFDLFRVLMESISGSLLLVRLDEALFR